MYGVIERVVIEVDEVVEEVDEVVEVGSRPLPRALIGVGSSSGGAGERAVGLDLVLLAQTGRQTSTPSSSRRT
jgi:hypothetical protein